MNLTYIRGEIEHMRRQILRQRKEIQTLERAELSTKSAEELLARLQTRVDGRRILRAADQHFSFWVALQEEKCVGENYHKLREFRRQRKLSLSRHRHSVTWVPTG